MAAEVQGKASAFGRMAALAQAKATVSGRTAVLAFDRTAAEVRGQAVSRLHRDEVVPDQPDGPLPPGHGPDAVGEKADLRKVKDRQ